MLGKRLPEIEKTGNIFKESIISFKVNKINTKYNDPFLVDLIDISFEVKEGEIFGIAGIAGNGQSELMNILTGEETLKNPSNINLSVGKPEDTSEAKTADGPGIDSILHPTFIACLTNLYAGSDIAGVPASVITAT